MLIELLTATCVSAFKAKFEIVILSDMNSSECDKFTCQVKCIHESPLLNIGYPGPEIVVPSSNIQ